LHPHLTDSAYEIRIHVDFGWLRHIPNKNPHYVNNQNNS